ncbi:putative Membrane-associated protein, partial [Diplonema papillatum]
MMPVSPLGLLLLLGLVESPEAAAEPCMLNDDETACIGDSNGCVWTQPTLGTPGTCDTETCKFTDELNCASDKSCEWESACPSKDGWKCVRQQCMATTQAECIKNPQCEWSASLKCRRTICGQYPTETCCKSEDCDWNTKVSPAICVEKMCTKTYKTESSCNANSACMWHALKGYCTEMNCNDVDECSCRNAPGCYWHVKEERCVDEKYGLCPALEIVVAIESSSSANTAFGRHANGYKALLEVLRDWAKDVPLTGETTAVNAGLTRGGIRLGIVQFSGQEPYRKCVKEFIWCLKWQDYPGTTESKQSELTGTFSAINSNINTQSTAINKGARIQAGMVAAGNLFKKAASNRKKILFIFVDSTVVDFESTGTALTTLNNQGVVRFGIVLRKGSSQSSADTTAVNQLKTQTSSPTGSTTVSMTHDMVASNLFDKICEPTSTFGKYIVGTGVDDNDQAGYHKPCETYNTAFQCAVDRGCHWSSSDQDCL